MTMVRLASLALRRGSEDVSGSSEEDASWRPIEVRIIYSLCFSDAFPLAKTKLLLQARLASCGATFKGGREGDNLLFVVRLYHVGTAAVPACWCLPRCGAPHFLRCNTVEIGKSELFDRFLVVMVT